MFVPAVFPPPKAAIFVVSALKEDGFKNKLEAKGITGIPSLSSGMVFPEAALDGLGIEFEFIVNSIWAADPVVETTGTTAWASMGCIAGTTEPLPGTLDPINSFVFPNAVAGWVFAKAIAVAMVEERF